jgi:hypothetical protein
LDEILEMGANVTDRALDIHIASLKTNQFARHRLVSVAWAMVSTAEARNVRK